MSTPKDVILPTFNNEENLNEPIFSYSVYTVDAVLNHRYLNYTHKDFPNHVGILKGQYLEIEWNILNADLITISGVGLVKAVGRKAFYPTGNTTYTITAKNKEYELSQTIYVRVFPVSVSDHLITKTPNIRIQSQQITKTPEVTKLPLFTVDKPVLNTEKPNAVSLHEVLQDKIVTKSFTQKINDYLSLNKPTN
ncbi:MAG: hypothetical protein KAX69_05060 [Chitinophagales bacterium]|nr:hypothetical protein [Chitinophagales bacterium]